jgi:hypothetical protein
MSIMNFYISLIYYVHCKYFGSTIASRDGVGVDVSKKILFIQRP